MEQVKRHPMGYNQHGNNAFKLIRQSTLINKINYCIRFIVMVSCMLLSNEDYPSFHLKFNCSCIHYNCSSMYYQLRMCGNYCKTCLL